MATVLVTWADFLTQASQVFPRDKHHQLHFADVATEAQKGEVTYLSSLS